MDDSAYLTPLTATISMSVIKEIMGVSQMVMFPNSYSRGISTWTGDDNCINRSFQDMAAGFLRLEEFGERGPTDTVGIGAQSGSEYARNISQLG